MTARANGEGHGEPRIRKPAQPGALPGPPGIPGEAAGGRPLPSGHLRPPPAPPAAPGSQRPAGSQRHPRAAHTPRGCVLASGTPRGGRWGQRPPHTPHPRKADKQRIISRRGKNGFFQGVRGGISGAASPPALPTSAAEPRSPPPSRGRHPPSGAAAGGDAGAWQRWIGLPGDRYGIQRLIRGAGRPKSQIPNPARSGTAGAARAPGRSPALDEQLQKPISPRLMRFHLALLVIKAL